MLGPQRRRSIHLYAATEDEHAMALERVEVQKNTMEAVFGFFMLEIEE
jgi:hypothetical protein